MDASVDMEGSLGAVLLGYCHDGLVRLGSCVHGEGCCAQTSRTRVGPA